MFRLDPIVTMLLIWSIEGMELYNAEDESARRTEVSIADPPEPAPDVEDIPSKRTGALQMAVSDACHN